MDATHVHGKRRAPLSSASSSGRSDLPAGVSKVDIESFSECGNTVIAEKRQPCLRDTHDFRRHGEEPVSILANFATITMDDKPTERVYLYELKITHESGRGMKMVQGGGADALKAEKQRICRNLFETLYKEKLHKMGLKAADIIFDDARLLFALRKFDTPVKLENVSPGAEFGDARYTVEVSSKDMGQSSFDLKDYYMGDDPSLVTDLKQRDRSVPQFVDIITQKLMKEAGAGDMRFGTSFFNAELMKRFSRECGDSRSKGALMLGRDRADKSRFIITGVGRATKVVENRENPRATRPMLAMAVDMKRAVIAKDMCVVDYVQQQLGDRFDMRRWGQDGRFDRSSMKKVEDSLKGLFVRTTHRKERDIEFKVTAVVDKNARTQTFKKGTPEASVDITVADYFKSGLGIQLRYPNMPLVLRAVGNRKDFYPMELLRIMPNQRLNNKQMGKDGQANFIKACAVHPAERLRHIQDFLNGDDIKNVVKGMHQYRLDMKLTMLHLEGRKMAAVRLAYNRKQVVPSERGQWQMRSERFFLPAQFEGLWATMQIATQLHDGDMNKIAEDFANKAKEHGIVGLNSETYAGPINVADRSGDPKCVIDSFRTAVDSKIKFVLIIMKFQDEDVKALIKYLEAQRGILTQVVLVQNVLAQVQQQDDFGGRGGYRGRGGRGGGFRGRGRGGGGGGFGRGPGRETWQNIVAKTNLKLGGINYIIDEHEQMAKRWLVGRGADDVMLMAVLLDKPAQASRLARLGAIRDPAVLSLVATTHSEKLKMFGGYALQPACENETIKLKELTKKAMANFAANHNGNLPLRVVVYRADVSEGALQLVNSQELPAIKAAWYEMSHGDNGNGNNGNHDVKGATIEFKKCKMEPNAEPKFTVVVYTKKHDARLFVDGVKNMQHARPGEANIKAGTVVDHGIVHPANTEFFLCSHSAFQGTARAVKYTLLHDDGNFVDEPGNLAQFQLQQLTWLLCHGHQIVTKAVSLPFVAMGADRMMKRCRTLFKAHMETIGDMSVGSGDSDKDCDTITEAITANSLPEKDHAYWA